MLYRLHCAHTLNTTRRAHRVIRDRNKLGFLFCFSEMLRVFFLYSYILYYCATISRARTCVRITSSSSPLSLGLQPFFPYSVQSRLYTYIYIIHHIIVSHPLPLLPALLVNYTSLNAFSVGSEYIVVLCNKQRRTIANRGKKFKARNATT